MEIIMKACGLLVGISIGMFFFSLGRLAEYLEQEEKKDDGSA